MHNLPPFFASRINRGPPQALHVSTSISRALVAGKPRASRLHVRAHRIHDVGIDMILARFGRVIADASWGALLLRHGNYMAPR